MCYLRPDQNLNLGIGFEQESAFRASDFGQVAKTNLVRANRSRLVVGKWCSGHLFFARVIQNFSSVFGLKKIQANVHYCYVWRRAEGTSLGPGLKYRSLR